MRRVAVFLEDCGGNGRSERQTNGDADMPDRDTNGKFQRGNRAAAGRGRRRRTLVPPEYLGALGDVITLDVWKRIIAKAVEGALEGDAQARGWIAKLLFTGSKASLEDVAAIELSGRTVDDVLAQDAERFPAAPLADVLREQAELDSRARALGHASGDSMLEWLDGQHGEIDALLADLRRQGLLPDDDDDAEPS